MSEENSNEARKGQIMFFPGSKRFFGLAGKESNFELFTANCLIEQLTLLTKIEEHLETIAKNSKPKAKARAKRK